MITKTLFVLLLLSISVASTDSSNKAKFSRGIDGGMECATCTVFVGLLDQLAEVHNKSIVHVFNDLCDKLPIPFSKACQITADVFGPGLVEMVAERANPDDICRGFGLCFSPMGEPRCALYKKTLQFNAERVSHYQQKTRLHLLKKWNVKMTNGSWNICDVPFLKVVCDAFQDVFYKQMPFNDLDGDLHSTTESLRGASWRGKDCNDIRNDVYPGRRPGFLNDSAYDSNCNGIWGFDAMSGETYEEKFCQDSTQMGVVVIGDSVGAHFHAPEEWFDPQLLTEESLVDLPFAIENELDWPQLSLVTGYMNSTWSIAPGKTDSIYSRLVQRNRCNHRNYQNIALNGDDSFEVLNLTKTLRSHPQQDYPLLIFVELVGNDVCNRAPSDVTLDHMTTTSQMHDNLVRMFDVLNEQVPPNSKVLIIGMADGDFIYKFLAKRYHPFGRLRKDLTYPDIYDWWNCMQVTPCTGWLNSNATLRKLTTDRANNLSAVMSDLAKSHQHHWSNLEINYLTNPITTVINKYLFSHGPDSGYQLIEPVDGFHPNQLGQALSAAEVWNHMETSLPHYLGRLNPHNSAIVDKFKDQGGY